MIDCYIQVADLRPLLSTLHTSIVDILLNIVSLTAIDGATYPSCLIPPPTFDIPKECWAGVVVRLRQFTTHTVLEI